MTRDSPGLFRRTLYHDAVQEGEETTVMNLEEVRKKGQWLVVDVPRPLSRNGHLKAMERKEGRRRGRGGRVKWKRHDKQTQNMKGRREERKKWKVPNP